MRALYLIPIFLAVFVLPAGASGIYHAELTWHGYMQSNVYGRADRRCSRTRILCGDESPESFLSLGRPNRPRPGDGLQLRFGPGGAETGRTSPPQEPAPITDAVNFAAPVINTGLCLAALMLFLL
ncbi:MAG: hypothetical protein ABIJ96_16620 [Elusimicrobiota bacterium]